MSALHRNDPIPRLVPPWERVPNACPSHPGYEMKLVVVVDRELWACAHPAHDTGAMNKLPAEKPAPETPPLTIRARGLTRALHTPHPVPPVPPPALRQQMQRVADVEGLDTLQVNPARVPKSPPFWVNEPMPEQVPPTPERPRAEMILSELAEGDDLTTPTIRAIRRRTDGRLSGALGLESEREYD